MSLSHAKKGPPSLAIILGSKHEPDDGDEDGGDGDKAKMDAAEALIDAVHAKDPEAVLEAIGALHKLHTADEDDDEPEDEEND